MSNLIQQYENDTIQKLVLKKSIPTFRAGDTLKVTLKIVEGERSRLQAFEGICIARKNNLLNSKFTVRKISHGEGVERIFPLFSPNIDKIEVIRKGDVNRAKLYYLRKRTGKSARIADSDRGEEADQYIMSESAKENVQNTQNEKKETKEKESTSDENKEVIDSNDNIENKLSPEKPEEQATKEKASNEEESASPAPEAEKTEDESK